MASGHGGTDECAQRKGHEAAKTIKSHWQGILQFVDSRNTTGIVEGLNSKIKTAMKRTYGFKSFEYLRTVIYKEGKSSMAHTNSRL